MLYRSVRFCALFPKSLSTFLTPLSPSSSNPPSNSLSSFEDEFAEQLQLSSSLVIRNYFAQLAPGLGHQVLREQLGALNAALIDHHLDRLLDLVGILCFALQYLQENFLVFRVGSLQEVNYHVGEFSLQTGVKKRKCDITLPCEFGGTGKARAALRE